MKNENKALYPTLTAMALALSQAYADTLPPPVPRVIVSAPSAWGTAADAWAGYTGELKVWLPAAVQGGWTLSFESEALGRQARAEGFWNTQAEYDPATHRFTLSSPGWSGDLPANGIITIGFNGTGVLETGFALTGCRLNAEPCTASVMTPEDAAQTLANLKESGEAAPIEPVTPPPSQPPIDQPPAAALELLFAIDSAWEGGYGGQVTVKNHSNQSLDAGALGWQARLKFPDEATARDVFKSGPWNFQVAFEADGTTILTPMAWAGSLEPGKSTSSGFNGGSVASLKQAASADSQVAVLFAPSVTDDPTPPNPPTPDEPSDPVLPPADPVQPPPGDVGLPTGEVVGGFLFSPYKDLGISMNWNTNVMSTKATGTLSPLLSVLPESVSAVTWAFATGECGQENWAGIKPEAVATANVPVFVAANKDYVISTGGAAGAFTCSSPEGMRTFINRYASKNLVAVDFDIEAGQSVASIESLVKQIQAVETDYPNLRFSFTIATLGSSNGLVTTAPYGDLNVTGYNVIQALKKYPVNNYTINLMVMDYGPASAGVCVLKPDGLCDMGQTAIQAARNLTLRYGIPNERIELTPMIGVNDVVDELFSLEDTGTMVQWALENHLAGVHFWSVDRDTPCTSQWASPVCSSVAEIPTWSWTRAFTDALNR